MNKFNTPIVKNIIANLFKVVIVFLNQIVLVPLYIRYWGTALYGDWIVLSAITSFFSLSDMGLNNVTNNRFCIKLAEGNNKECQSLLVNNIVLIFSFGLLSIIGMILFCVFCDLPSVLSLHIVEKKTAAVVLITTVVQVFIVMLSGVFDSIYNANHLASKATYIGNFARFSYAILIFLCILLRLQIDTIVLIASSPYIIALVYKLIDSKRLFNYTLSLKEFDMQLFSSLIKPSVAYMCFPIANVFSFQGFTLIINAYFGATTLVLFNTTRTMVNFIRTIVETITNGVKPEISIVYGKRDVECLNNIHRQSFFVTLSIALFACLILLVFGRWIYTVWTEGAIEFNLPLMLAFFAVVLFNTSQNASSAVILATNNHVKLGIVSMITSAISLFLAWIIAPLNLLPAIALCIALPELAMALYAYPKARKIINLLNVPNKMILP